MQKARMGYRVGVFGHYGHDNMGDEAIIEAVIQNLRMRSPELSVVGFSMNPEDTLRRYGIPAYPIRNLDAPMQKARMGDRTPWNAASLAKRSSVARVRDFLKRFALLRTLVRAARFVVRLPRELWGELVFLRDSYRIARHVDCFFIAGSGQFMDAFGGVWGFPYTLLKWAVLARCAGARVVFVSVGAGPIESLWSRLMVRAALSLADYVSFRDPGSRRLIEWFGSGKRWRVYPDLAQSLQFERDPARDERMQLVVGINPMAVYDPHYWYLRDDTRYEGYVGQLARFASRLMQEHYRIFFFGTQPSDEAVIDDVIVRLDGEVVVGRVLPDRMKQSKTVSEMIKVIGSADIVVATRFHGAVLAFHAHRPVLGICYNTKTRELLRERGQETYAVDLDEIADAELWRVFRALAANRHEEIRKIKRKSDEVHALLAEQYDLVLEIVRARTATAQPTARERVH